MITESELLSLMDRDAKAVTSALENELSSRLVISEESYPALREAMMYSALSGGKRIRPFLTLEFCRALGGPDVAAMPFACGIEMMHAYSLIHDDLPCMDNDDLRRGRPTCHVVYGYSGALLAGDALQALAFEVTASNPAVPAKDALLAVSTLAGAAGGDGMCGGQQLDLESEKRPLSFDELELTQKLKTGRLIECAARFGVIAAGKADDGAAMAAADEYAFGVGRAFQIIDDILDVTGDESVLGKPVGDDEKAGKTTFMTYMTVTEAEKYAANLTESAIRAVSGIDRDGILTAAALWMLKRRK